LVVAVSGCYKPQQSEVEGNVMLGVTLYCGSKEVSFHAGENHELGTTVMSRNGTLGWERRLDPAMAQRAD